VIRSRLRRRAGDEDGFIIIIVMVLLMIVLLVGAAALAESLAARDNASRSARSARALQAADAGVQTALYELNQLNLGALALSDGANLASIVTQLDTCPVPEVNAQGAVDGLTFSVIAALGDACPLNQASGVTGAATNWIPIGDHAYYELDFTPGPKAIGDFTQFDPTIVALGEDDGGGNPDVGTVYRRVEAILAPIQPFRTLEAVHNLTFDVPAPAVTAGATAFNATAAAGNNVTFTGLGTISNVFTMSNVSLASGTEPSAIDYCGTSTHPNVTIAGTGNVTQPTSGCSGLVARPTIQLSGTKTCSPSCSGLTGYTTANGGPEIYITNHSTLTFAPGDYVFCSFDTNGAVDMNPTYPPSAGLGAVRIFIASPTSPQCSGWQSHNGISAGSFVATAGVTNSLAATHPSQAQIYVVGSPVSNGTPTTSVTITASGLASGEGAFVYAPTSSVTVSSTALSGVGGALAGAFIGYNLTAEASTISEDLGLLNYPLSSTLGPFYVQQYIECNPVSSMPAVPTTGC
jgi:hypothetical protein